MTKAIRNPHSRGKVEVRIERFREDLEKEDFALIGTPAYEDVFDMRYNTPAQIAYNFVLDTIEDNINDTFSA